MVTILFDTPIFNLAFEMNHLKQVEHPGLVVKVDGSQLAIFLDRGFKPQVLPKTRLSMMQKVK